MNEMKSRVIKTFQDVSGSKLWDEELPISLEEYNALLSEQDTEKLCHLIELDDTEAIKRVTLEDLMRMPFGIAQKTIEQFSLAKRIEELESLETLRIYLYSQASKYGVGKPTDPDYFPVSEWKIVMGKIKHLEILQAWLYGII